MLKTLEVKKQRRLAKKQSSGIRNARVEARLKRELLDKLKVTLGEFDSCLIEVQPNFSGNFQNILDDSILSMYDCEQQNATEYVFKNKKLEW